MNPHPTRQPASSTRAARPVDAVVVCLACRTDFDAFPEPGEAGYFAVVHNGLHHGRRPEAFVADLDPTPPGGEAA